MKNHKCCPSFFDSQSRGYLIAVLLGLLSGYLGYAAIQTAASAVSQVFISLLKLVSLPIIFLSIVSTASGMESLDEIKHLGKRVIKYTFLTTAVAAALALLIFVVVQPVRTTVELVNTGAPVEAQGSYFHYLLQAVPSNIVQPFSENQVMGVLFLAIALSLSILALPDDKRKILHNGFSSLYSAIMKMTTFIVRFMPIAVWAFVTLFFRDLKQGLEMESIALYLFCVVLANVIQGVVLLPLLLKYKKISPIALFKGMMPALSVAFFTKSSSATLPMAMECAEQRVGISKKVASFSLPLCTTINMNGCSAFILTTVLFVSMSHGMTYSPMEMILWIGIATIAAVGNAGVPMGCYFLSTAFLAAMNVPLNILGIILPFYTFIDMLETSLNVWSDSCVTAIVQKEIPTALPALAVESNQSIEGEKIIPSIQGENP